MREPATGPEPAGNPDWARDEIILALELFVQAGSLGGNPLPGETDSGVSAVSDHLARLPVHPRSQRRADFRSPTSVALKLANFRAIERDLAIERGEHGADGLPTGMRSYSQLDRSIFEQYEGRWELLSSEAAAVVDEGLAAPDNDQFRKPAASRRELLYIVRRECRAIQPRLRRGSSMAYS